METKTKPAPLGRRNHPNFTDLAGWTQKALQGNMLGARDYLNKGMFDLSPPGASGAWSCQFPSSTGKRGDCENLVLFRTNWWETPTVEPKSDRWEQPKLVVLKEWRLLGRLYLSPVKPISERQGSGSGSVWESQHFGAFWWTGPCFYQFSADAGRNPVGKSWCPSSCWKCTVLQQTPSRYIHI